MGCPIYPAGRCAEKRIFVIDRVCAAVFAERQSDVIRVKGERGISFEKTYIFTRGRIQMKVPAQCDVSPRGGDVRLFCDLMPRTVGDAIFALKAYLCRSGTECLMAVAPGEP